MQGALPGGLDKCLRNRKCRAGAHKVVKKNSPTDETNNRRILIVEDNVDAAETLQLLLRMSGYDTRAAYEGTAAIALAREFDPHVVLLDIGLPGKDGFEVARELRALPQTKSALLIALTGYGDDQDRNRAKEAGFDTLQVKPLEPEALEKILEEHFRSSER
jgi:CheY-like chemotaxis protein